MAEAMSRRWFSTVDLCARYGVSRYTIRNWEQTGKLPRADRRSGRPRWWGPLIEAMDAQAEPAVVVGSAAVPGLGTSGGLLKRVGTKREAG
ncbi:MAG: MerR family DNA-binding transcriptional regulator [Planctomycetota bacterium]